RCVCECYTCFFSGPDDRPTLVYVLFFFFFQAEDGIRDRTVTGVQTCALPIFQIPQAVRRGDLDWAGQREHGVGYSLDRNVTRCRSEERRVGKECRSRWWPED